MLKLTSKEAKELSLDKFTANDARNMAKNYMTVYDEIKREAKMGYNELYYYFNPHQKESIVALANELRDNGFNVIEEYNYVSTSNNKYNFLYITW